MKQRGGHGTANEVRVRAGSDCGNPGWRMDVKITRSKKIEDIIFWGPSVLSNQSFQVQIPDSHQLSSKMGVQYVHARFIL